MISRFLRRAFSRLTASSAQVVHTVPRASKWIGSKLTHHDGTPNKWFFGVLIGGLIIPTTSWYLEHVNHREDVAQRNEQIELLRLQYSQAKDQLSELRQQNHQIAAQLAELRTHTKILGDILAANGIGAPALPVATHPATECDCEIDPNWGSPALTATPKNPRPKITIKSGKAAASRAASTQVKPVALPHSCDCALDPELNLADL